MKRHRLLHALALAALATTSPALAQPRFSPAFNEARDESRCAFDRNSGQYRDGDHACQYGISMPSWTTNRIAPCTSGEGPGSGCAEA